MDLGGVLDGDRVCARGQSGNAQLAQLELALVKGDAGGVRGEGGVSESVDETVLDEALDGGEEDEEREEQVEDCSDGGVFNGMLRVVLAKARDGIFCRRERVLDDGDEDVEGVEEAVVRLVVALVDGMMVML